MSDKPLILNGYTFLSKEPFAKGGEGDLHLVSKDNQTFVLKSCVKKNRNFEKKVEIYKFISTLDIDIPKLVDNFEFKQYYVFIMEYIEDNTNVCSFIKKTDYIMKKRFVNWLSSTVGKLHEHGISHCDIKLSNTLYSKSRDKFYLIDFGFSKYHNDCPIFCGTVIYMSPFMCKNSYSIIKKEFNEYYDNRENDRWALGIIAYLVYKGRHLYIKYLKNMMMTERKQ